MSDDIVGGYQDALVEEVRRLRTRNAFLEEQYEFILQRLEVLEDHHAEQDRAALRSKLKLTPQCQFFVAALLARYPEHVTKEWLMENLPNHDHVRSDQVMDPFNHIRIIASYSRTSFKKVGIISSVIVVSRVGYVLSAEAVAYLRQHNAELTG